jgi:FAD/FMN-containing dehydrogenase
MSSKVAHYLQEHLVGEVISGTNAREYFSTDGSILQAAPLLVVYPKSENDIRKTARFSWQLAERGRIIPLIARGGGTDQTGAAIGGGMVLAFQAHMNRILELDGRTHTVTIEPGLNYARLQEVLHTHGRFLPPYPSSIDYSTVGGAIANNRSGERSYKYGPTLNFVKGLRVILANGEVIQTGRLGKRDLSKKLGLATFEGEIYRSIDTLIEEKQSTLELMHRNLTLNNAGYNLIDIKRKDGSFDLTPLIVGSQGTLGIITEATMDTEPYDPQSTLLMSYFDSIEFLQQALIELKALNEGPSTVEFIDKYALDQVYEYNPNHLKDNISRPYPSFILLMDFEGSEKGTKKAIRSVTKILDKFAQQVSVITDPEEQIKARKIRDSVNMLVASEENQKHALPLFDGSVPVDRLREYIEGIYKILAASNVQPAIWGHAGDANLFIRPNLNLSHVGDRQKVFKLLDEFHKLVLGLNGTISASSGEGRLRAPYLEPMYGSEVYDLLYKIKQIFDPYGTMNPGVKFGTNIDDLRSGLRPSYNLSHLYGHLPRA